MNYRRMEATALVAFGACAAVLGCATAVFDLTETQAMVLFLVYLIGGLPAILCLHFIAKAQRSSPMCPAPPLQLSIRRSNTRWRGKMRNYFSTVAMGLFVVVGVVSLGPPAMRKRR